MNHTPGPWEVKEDVFGYWGIYGRGGECIAETTEREDEANARLIAAAPELARLCSDLLNPKNAVEPIRCEVKKILRRVYGEYEEE